MTLLDLKNQIDKMLKDNPENAHKKLVQWDIDGNELFSIDEINLWVKNNILLIRIPYTQYKNLNIKDLLLETSNFIIKGEKNDN